VSQEVGHRPHSGILCSIAGQTMSDSWWTNRHWHMFSTQYFGFTLAVSFQRWSILLFIYICIYEKDKRPRPGNLPKSGDHWIEENFLRIYLVDGSSVPSLYTINPTKKSCCNTSEFGLQAVKPSQARVLTGGGDLREGQVDVPLSVSHTCIWSHSWAL